MKVHERDVGENIKVEICGAPSVVEHNLEPIFFHSLLTKTRKKLLVKS